MTRLLQAQHQFFVQSDNAHHYGGPVERASNGDLIQLVTDGSTGLYMIRTDSNGVSLLNQKFMHLNQNEQPTGLVITDDNSCLILVSVSSLAGIYPTYSVKTDSQGNILWTKFHKTERPSLIICYAEMPNGTILLGGKMQELNSTNSDMMIMCIDTAGNQLWCKTYAKVGDESVSGITLLSGNDLMISAMNLNTGNGLYNNYLVKLSASGNFINARDFTDDVNPVVLRPGKFNVTSSGRKFLSAHLMNTPVSNTICTMLLELDSTNQVIQYAAFKSFPAQYFYAMNSGNAFVYENSNGGINLFTSSWWGAFPSVGFSSFFISLDNQLNLLNTYRSYIYATEIIITDMIKITDDIYIQSCHLKDHMYTSPLISNYSRLNKINPLSPASCFFSQTVNLTDTAINFIPPVPISFSENTHVVSDSIGTSVSLYQILPVWSCLPVGIDESEASEPFKVFPNPFNTETFINTSGQHLENAKILLDDVQGRNHESGFSIQESGDGIRFINQSLSAGCYYLIIQKPGKIQRIKLMIL